MDYPMGLLVLLALVIGWRLISGISAGRSQRRRDTPELASLPGELVHPPDDVHDAAAWDQYWERQFAIPELAALHLMCDEMFCDDRELVDLMKRKGMHSVLCVGHGVSREPAALAKAGLSVVALDISPRAGELTRELPLDEESLHRFIDPGQEAEGGGTEFVVGNLLDSGVCPGPFDVILERKTAQLFGEKRGEALEALAARLATPGVLFSHCHDGFWKPPQSPEHANEAWFRDNGWTVFHTAPRDDEISGKVAWLFLSTG